MTFGPGGTFDPNHRPGENRPGPSQPYPGSVPQAYGAPGPMPNNYLGWAIVTTIFCCLPLGIVAIVKSTSVAKLWAAGDAVGAQRASDSAKTYSIVSAAIGVVVAIASAAALAFGGLAMLDLNSEFQSDAEFAPTSTYSSTATWSAPSSRPTAPSTGFELCVLNAGRAVGLSARYKSQLESAGYIVSESGNLATASIIENTVFYNGPDQEAQAKEIAIAIGAIAVERPATFPRCAGQIVVAVVD